MSYEMQAEELAKELVTKLEKITDEKTIKLITLEIWKKLQELIPNPNSFKRPSKTFRSVIENAFPSGSDPKPGFYYTSSGKLTSCT